MSPPRRRDIPAHPQMNSCPKPAPPALRRRPKRADLTLETLELLDERLDLRGHFTPLALPFPLVALERAQLLDQCGSVLAMKLVLQILNAVGELVALATQPLTVFAQLLNHGGRLFHAVGQAVQIDRTDRAFGHRSL